jgi:hypothetical protein
VPFIDRQKGLFLDILCTVYLRIILEGDQLDAQFLL